MDDTSIAILILKNAMAEQSREITELEDELQRREERSRGVIRAWRFLALQNAMSPNPWARMWKYMAKYWRNSYLQADAVKKQMTDLYLETQEGIARKLERVADRQGPGSLCETEQERNILRLLAEEIRGGRWR